jgi:uncharacterized protein (UPF0335 family)
MKNLDNSTCDYNNAKEYQALGEQQLVVIEGFIAQIEQQEDEYSAIADQLENEYQDLAEHYESDIQALIDQYAP